MQDRVIEYVDHLHEHFLDPVIIRNAHYQLPTAPGYSIQVKPRIPHPLRLPPRRRPGRPMQ